MHKIVKTSVVSGRLQWFFAWNISALVNLLISKIIFARNNNNNQNNMKLLIYDQFMKKKSRRLRLEKCNFRGKRAENNWRKYRQKWMKIYQEICKNTFFLSFFFSTLWSETVQTFFEDVLQGYVLLSVLRYVNEVVLKK